MQTIAFDFDGVIHSYVSGWKGADVIPDPPVVGIAEVMKILMDDGYRIVIFSTRAGSAGGVLAMTNYLNHYDIPYHEITDSKPMATVYVDDRAIQFKGQITTLVHEIESFSPYYLEPRRCRECKLSDHPGMLTGYCTKRSIYVSHTRVACDAFVDSLEVDLEESGNDHSTK